MSSKKMRSIDMETLGKVSGGAGPANHSTPANGRDEIKKSWFKRPPRPERYKTTVGLTRDQKLMEKNPAPGQNKVHWFSRTESKQNQLHMRNGLLHKKDSHGKLVPYDTGNMSARFIMKPSGKIIADARQHGANNAPIYHSSLGGGKRVAASGEMKVKDGRLVEINNRSGHYRPSADHHAQAVQELNRKGVTGFNSVTGPQGRPRVTRH